MIKNILIIGFIAIAGSLLAQDVAFEKANFKDNKDGFKTAKNNLKEGDEIYATGPTFYKKCNSFL